MARKFYEAPHNHFFSKILLVFESQFLEVLTSEIGVSNHRRVLWWHFTKAIVSLSCPTGFSRADVVFFLSMGSSDSLEEAYGCLTRDEWKRVKGRYSVFGHWYVLYYITYDYKKVEKGGGRLISLIMDNQVVNRIHDPYFKSCLLRMNDDDYSLGNFF